MPSPAGRPRSRPPSGPAGVTYAQLRSAALFDPAVFRAFWKTMGMAGPPAEIYTDPQVVACTQEVLRQRGGGPPVAQPTREQLLAALAR
jgi:hypothetical protein